MNGLEQQRRSIDGLPMKLLAMAFTAWAAVVAWGINQVTGRIEQMQHYTLDADLRVQQHEQQVLQRVAALEEHVHQHDQEHQRMSEAAARSRR